MDSKMLLVAALGLGLLAGCSKKAAEPEAADEAAGAEASAESSEESSEAAAETAEAAPADGEGE